MIPWDHDVQLCAEMAVCMEYRIPHSVFLRWDIADRAKAIWWLTRQRSTCQRCGTRDDEWDAGKPGYEAVERHCMGCVALERKQEELDKLPKERRPRGVSVVLRLLGKGKA